MGTGENEGRQLLVRKDNCVWGMCKACRGGDSSAWAWKKSSGWLRTIGIVP